MFIESIEPLHYGPFSTGEVLRLERDVTVLTGPNDVGKSCLLRLPARIFGPRSSKPQFDELHVDAEQRPSLNWDERVDFGGLVQVRLEGDDPPPFADLLGARSFTVRCNIAPHKRMNIIQAACTEAGTNIDGAWKLPPNLFRVVSLPPANEIRDIVEFKQPTEVELNLFRLGLGADVEFSRLGGMQAAEMNGFLTRAEKKLSLALQAVIPKSLGVRWRFRPSLDPPGILCSLEDRWGGQTPLGSRGGGVRKLMAVLAELMHRDISTGHWLVLFDEPETSLHADSQHLLRRLLESLAEKPNVQVIYATHSPSMINGLRPHSVRLLSRDSVDDKPRTRINNEPFQESFLLVRSSLGMSPADSLLYAPVTIVVEGDTEAVGLPLLLRKLMKAGVEGFGDAELLLSQCHFLDGMGDKLGFVLKLAKSQGAKPILFVDGDKKRHLAQHKLGETHPDVPQVLLPDGEEFEQIVSEEVYFRALAEVISDAAGRVTLDAYEEWEKNANLPGRIVFTKRVGRWLDALDLDEPKKAAVMRRAIELANPDQINLVPLRALLGHIDDLLRK